MQPILQIHDLHVHYGKVEALHGASLKVESGQIVTVIGPNGAGKSTLLNALAGALPHNAIAQGSIVLLGHAVDAIAVEARVERGMCLVPEKRELFSSMSVEDNLLLGSYRRFRAKEKSYADQMPLIYDMFPRLHERR
ncbi:MAG TPA: ATP-binding cassette domain-containing protein, partial [Burkholderiaceae bacterium]|nr:ATP-binding cassette domain-containing protein [Burkholderiaceae bacterium]